MASLIIYTIDMNLGDIKMVDDGGAGPPPERILRPESSVTSESSVQEK